MIQENSEAFVTLVTTDTYSIGALVLGYSLGRSGTRYPLVCLVTASVSSIARNELAKLYAVVCVEELDSKDTDNLAVLGRPELGSTFTKLHVWNLPLRKAVFLDADMLILKNIDDLFERSELSACADVGWPDCFNSGLFVCEPSKKTFAKLTRLAVTVGSFDGGDQGLLNTHFSDWSAGDASRRIPFLYNVTFNAVYSYAPAFVQFKDKLRAVHFIGTLKPWMYQRLTDGQIITNSAFPMGQYEFLKTWWSLHDDLVREYRICNGCTPQHHLSSSTHGEQDCDPHSTPISPSACARLSPLKASPDFATYKVTWGPEVERHFRKKQSDGAKERKMPAKDFEEDEQHHPIGDAESGNIRRKFCPKA